jgi:methionine-rich copper-binding protein CopC
MTRRTACRSAAHSLVFGALLVLGAHAARAAAVPVTMTPTRYAALTHAPRVLRLTFSEAIVGKSSSVTLTDLSGRQVRVEPVKAHGDDSLEARIGAKLGAGIYMVHWTSVSAVDGSKTTGSYQFTVQ